MTVKDAQKNEVTTDIQLTIEEQPYVEMMRYAHMFSPKECSGTGLVERVDYDDGSVEFVVTKVYLPNQINTGGTTDIEDEEMARVNTQVVMDGDDPMLHKFHWHSHVDMGVFHSGTDESNYDDMQTGDYAVSLVVNKKYDMLASVHLYAPLRINVLNIEVEPPQIDFTEYIVADDLQAKMIENYKRVAKFVEDNKPVTRNWGTGLGSGKMVNGVWTYADDYDSNKYLGTSNYSYAFGVENDPDFIALLEAGQNQSILTLDRSSDGDIIGYWNVRTNDYYELTSTLEPYGGIK